MLKRLSRALLAATVLVLAGAALTNAWSKPADLPLNIKETCVPACPDPVAPTVTLLGVEDALVVNAPLNDNLPEEQSSNPVQMKPATREELLASIGELVEKLTALLDQLKVELILEQAPLQYFRIEGGIAPREPVQEARPAQTAMQPLLFPKPGAITTTGMTLVGQQLFSGMPAKNEIKQVIGTSIMLGASVNSDAGLVGNIVLASRDPRSPIMSAEAFKSHQARHFYEIAELCEQRGDFEMARNCYEEASRVSPQSTFGVLASNLVAKMDIAAVERNVFSGAEVQELIPVVKKEIIHDANMDPRRLVESWRMLQLGEGFRLAGDLNNAFRCFQDSYAICPASRYGQAALDRMIEVERARSEQRPQQERRPRADGMEEQQLQVTSRPAYSDDELQQRERAHELFVLGENDLREGDLRAAYSRYQETHLAFPDCFFGMRAIERMQEIESRRK